MENEMENEEVIPNETKEAKFVRLAKQRMTATIKRIRQVGQLGNRSAYRYSDDQMEKIFMTIDQEVLDMKAKFSVAQKQDKAVSFSLD